MGISYRYPVILSLIRLLGLAQDQSRDSNTSRDFKSIGQKMAYISSRCAPHLSVPQRYREWRPDLSITIDEGRLR